MNRNRTGVYPDQIVDGPLLAGAGVRRPLQNLLKLRYLQFQLLRGLLGLGLALVGLLDHLPDLLDLLLQIGDGDAVRVAGLHGRLDLHRRPLDFGAGFMQATNELVFIVAGLHQRLQQLLVVLFERLQNGVGAQRIQRLLELRQHLREHVVLDRWGVVECERWLFVGVDGGGGRRCRRQGVTAGCQIGGRRFVQRRLILAGRPGHCTES